MPKSGRKPEGKLKPRLVIRYRREDYDTLAKAAFAAGCLSTAEWARKILSDAASRKPAAPTGT